MIRSLALATSLLLAGCATTRPVPVGVDFTLSPGERVALPDASMLRYAGIANDSRCPPGVQCIRAGDADVLVDHVRDGRVARIVLNTERTRSAPLGDAQLQLIEAGRGATAPATFRLAVRTAGGTSP
jgi:hypothetical protein